jgi:hypothetical protein
MERIFRNLKKGENNIMSKHFGIENIGEISTDTLLVKKKINFSPDFMDTFIESSKEQFITNKIISDTLLQTSQESFEVIVYP